MILNLIQLRDKYNLNIKGVAHIGAHYGEEHEVYLKMGIKNIIYFEPIPWNFEILKKNVSNSLLFNIALGSEEKKVEMYVERSNNSQSCSILAPEIHLKQYPHITFNERLLVEQKRLDDLKIDLEYNMINIDVQGYELEVFKGALETLNKIDYIYSEVNCDEVYKNCVRVEELDVFLAKYKFVRVETNWVGKTWGDALYIKNYKYNNSTKIITSDFDTSIKTFNSFQVELKGGLGNCLFQAYFAYCMSKKYSLDYGIVYQQTTHSTIDYRKNILKCFNFNNFSYPEVIFEPNDSAIYLCDIPISPQKRYNGYFQNCNYWNDTQEVDKYIISYLDSIKLNVNVTFDDIFVHVRCGDFLNFDVHQVGIHQSDYFLKAIQELNKAKIWIISDDIQFCKRKLNSIYNIEYFSGNELECLALMSRCGGGVGSNSSFSWWGIYFCYRKTPTASFVFSDRFTQTMKGTLEFPKEMQVKILDSDFKFNEKVKHEFYYDTTKSIKEVAKYIINNFDSDCVTYHSINISILNVRIINHYDKKCKIIMKGDGSFDTSLISADLVNWKRLALEAPEDVAEEYILVNNLEKDYHKTILFGMDLLTKIRSSGQNMKVVKLASYLKKHTTKNNLPKILYELQICSFYIDRELCLQTQKEMIEVLKAGANYPITSHLITNFEYINPKNYESIVYCEESDLDEACKTYTNAIIHTKSTKLDYRRLYPYSPLISSNPGYLSGKYKSTIFHNSNTQKEVLNYYERILLCLDTNMKIIDIREVRSYIICRVADDNPRYIHMKEVTKQHNLNAIIGNYVPSVTKDKGCYLAHRKTIKEALAVKPFQPFIVYEDDIDFFEPVNYQLVIPPKTDMIYLGVSNYKYRPDYVLWQKDVLGYYRVDKMLSAHGILYLTEKAAKLALSCIDETEKRNSSWDIYLAHSQVHINALVLGRTLVYQNAKYGGQEVQTKFHIAELEKK